MMATGMIGQVNIGNDSYLIGSTLFAAFDTNEGGTITDISINNTTYKQYYVPLAGFVNAKGLTIHILFKQANTTNTSNIALKVGGSDALPILNENGAKTWAANSVISFTNDGYDHWIMNSTQIDVSNVTIDVSQLSNLTLGNINSDGTISSHASQAVVTDSTSKITALDLSVDDPTTNGNTLSFIDSISQDSQGKITATKKTVQSASRSQAGVIQLPSGSTTTKFLREDGNWEVPAYTTNTDTHVNVTKATTTKAYILGVSTTPTTTAQALEAISDTGVYLDTTAGRLSATSFIGNGSNLTNLDADNLTTGTVSIAQGGTGTSSVAANLIFAGPSSGNDAAPSFRSLVSEDIPSNVNLTGIPTAPTADNGTNTTQIATTAFVTSEINSKLAANDAMLFKGTIGTDAGATAANLPAKDYQAGWTYRVLGGYTIEDGTSTITCEDGDLIIAINDGPTSGSSITPTDWTVVQTNIEGAVTGPSSSNPNHIAVFSSTTGKVINDTGITVTSEATGFKISGGTISKTLTVSRDITLGTAAGKNYQDSTSAAAIGTSSNLTTERDVYYGLPFINHSHNYNSSNDFYAPTNGGTTGQYLKASGSNTEPTWETFEPGTVGLDNVSNNSNLNNNTGTKGDLIYWSNTDVPDRLAASADGYVLTLSSGVPTWAENQATDEKVALTAITTSTSGASYYAVLSSTSSPATAAKRLYDSSIAFNLIKGTTNTSTGSGYATLILGNNTSKGSAANLTGRIRLYGFSTSYTDIIGAPVTSAQTLTLPSISGGNLVGTSTVGKVGDTDKPVYIAANGVATAIDYTIEKSVPPDAVFTDTTYSASTVDVLNNLTLTYNNGSAHSETPSTATFVGAVTNGILYLKSIIYNTTNVNTGFGPSV